MLQLGRVNPIFLFYNPAEALLRKKIAAGDTCNCGSIISIVNLHNISLTSIIAL
jgi:hypothetical protein